MNGLLHLCVLEASWKIRTRAKTTSTHTFALASPYDSDSRGGPLHEEYSQICRGWYGRRLKGAMVMVETRSDFLEARHWAFEGKKVLE